MTKDTFEAIKKQYGNLLIVESDVEDALDFVRDLLEAEAQYIERTEPYATNTVRTLLSGAYEIFSLGLKLTNADFDA
jgi:hypothetical protein